MADIMTLDSVLSHHEAHIEVVELLHIIEVFCCKLIFVRLGFNLELKFLWTPETEMALSAWIVNLLCSTSWGRKETPEWSKAYVSCADAHAVYHCHWKACISYSCRELCMQWQRCIGRGEFAFVVSYHGQQGYSLSLPLSLVSSLLSLPLSLSVFCLMGRAFCERQRRHEKRPQ